MLDAMDRSGLELRRFFNTSGKIYRERKLKDQVGTMSPQEAAAMLSQEGMLIKRPLLITDDKVLVGFSEKTYEELK